MRSLSTSPPHNLILSLIVLVLILGLLLMTGVSPATADGFVPDATVSPLGDVEDGVAVGNVVDPVLEGDSATGDESISFESEGDAAPLPAASDAQLKREVALEPLSEYDGSVPLVAEGLAGEPTHFVSKDVFLDSGESVLGSFTVDGMTYAVTGEGEVELAAVGNHMAAGGLAAGSSGAEGAGRGIGSGVPT